MAAERKWPSDPNYWLLLGICSYGVLALLLLALTMAGLLSVQSWAHVASLLVLPGAGSVLVFGLQFGSQDVRFHPAMLIGFLVMLALALLVYLQFAGVI